jgi:hypothetical protein
MVKNYINEHVYPNIEWLYSCLSGNTKQINFPFFSDFQIWLDNIKVHSTHSKLLILIFVVIYFLYYPVNWKFIF